jgi:VHL beta domain
MKFLTAVSVVTGVIVVAGISGALISNHHSGSGTPIAIGGSSSENAGGVSESSAAPPTSAAPSTGAATSAAPSTGAATSAAASGSAGVQFTVTGASQQSCSAEGTVSSSSAGQEIPFYFQNDTSESLQIVWINYSGSPQTYDTLPPGYAYHVNTFVGNVWVIGDASSSCLGLFDIEGSGHITASS